MKSIINEFKGHIKYDNLSDVLEILKENDKLDILSVYLGDINGIYSVSVGNDDSYLYDLFFTDGLNSGFSAKSIRRLVKRSVLRVPVKHSAKAGKALSFS